MKNRIFSLSLLVFLLSATIKPTSLSAMEKDEGGLFGKGNRGFLLKKAKKDNNPTSIAPNVSLMSVPMDSSEPEEKSTNECAGIWDDQQYKGADALNFIFSVLREKTEALDARNLKHLPRIKADITELLTNSSLLIEEFKIRLAGFYFFHMFLKDFNAYALIYGSALPEQPNYLMHHIPV